MKKNILLILSIIVFATANVAHSKIQKTSELAEAIKLYKAGNYTECYMVLENVLAHDTGNALAHYYMAITATQIGKTDEALSNYEKVLTLVPNNNNLKRYAQRGKLCIEDPSSCNSSNGINSDESFILNNRGEKFSETVQADFERLKLENFKREMNRKDSIEKQKFNEFKDFSSEAPTNDEIVMALRILQKAGLNDIISRNNSFDLSALTGDFQNNSMYGVMGSSSMNPQLIQALLTNSMTQGF